MKLLYSETSPFARKVRVVARELRLNSSISEITTNPFAADTPLTQHNPLGKIPTLIRDDGSALYDSAVICTYLNSLRPGSSLYPASGEARWQALRQAALGDGIMEAVVALRLESLRPEEKRNPPTVDRLTAAVRRGLASITESDLNTSAGLTIGHVALACCLGYLDLRLAAEDWRTANPALEHFYRQLGERASFSATAHPSG